MKLLGFARELFFTDIRTSGRWRLLENGVWWQQRTQNKKRLHTELPNNRTQVIVIMMGFDCILSLQEGAQNENLSPLHSF